MLRPFSAAMLALLLSLPVQAEARPVSATLYPGGAAVTEEELAMPDQGRIRLTLPAGIDAASLDITLDGDIIKELDKLLGAPR